MMVIPFWDYLLPSVFFLSVAALVSCCATVVLATLVWSQTSLPSSQPGIHHTHVGVESCCLVPLRGGHQVSAFVEEIIVSPLMRLPLQSMLGFDASKNGYPKMKSSRPILVMKKA